MGFKRLDKHWSQDTKSRFAALPAKDVIGADVGVGMWMPNNWGLWGGGALQDFFVARKVHHPGSMSTMPLDAYWLKLQGCEITWNDTGAISSAFKHALQGEHCDPA